MSVHVRSRTRPAMVAVAAVAALTAAFGTPATAAGPPPGVTTAWHDGAFRVDVPGIVHRSDVVLGQPNSAPAQAMPLGNGSLGVGVWSADGFSAQLNRADTMPDRLSPGQIVIPGLSALTGAPDYHGRLDPYDGTFTESGGGMTATTYVRTDSDELVVSVTGAKPDVTQTAQLKLWQPRTPTASVSGGIGTLAQNWTDNSQPGASGQPFGTLAAVTATGRDVTASTVDPLPADARSSAEAANLAVQVSFRPDSRGRFQVVVAAPHWTGGNASATARALFGRPVSQAATSRWWHDFWGRAGLMRLSSSDGVAQYMENLRVIDLFTAAAERGTDRPGSQAGVADLFDTSGDTHSWDPASYWHWNLRMQVAANIGAGVPELNDSYFQLYAGNLANIDSWTSQQFTGSAGACVPETMRYNGIGVQVHLANGQWGANPYLDCSGTSKPNFNARTLTTGAEVSLWAWQQYLTTDDTGFLARSYPLMADSARFLLSYAKTGADGNLHTDPSNAHETQWDVSDPTTDIAAMSALFPAVIEAARQLHRDPALVTQLQAALAHIPPYARTDAATHTQLLSPSADAQGTDVIGDSYQPTATLHNTENLGLEPVWPYDLIGDNGPLTALARRTFAARPNPLTNDWSNDPIQAARLGLPADVASTLVALTEHYQQRPSGLASFGPTYPEPYAEQAGVVADAVQESLVQDYDGLLRIAPALPSGWDADATVYIQRNSKVDVQVRNGMPVTVAIEAGANGALQVRNPWPGRQVEVVTGRGPARTVVRPTSATVFSVPIRTGQAYLVEPVGSPTTALPYAPVTGIPADAIKRLGPVEIGLPPAN